MLCRSFLRVTLAMSLIMSVAIPLVAQDKAKPESGPASVLTLAQWEQVDRSVDRALAWLATQQRPDGSLPTHDMGQPAVTALGVLAFLSRGHLPGEAPYGRHIEKAVQFIVSCQRDDGLFSRLAPTDGQAHPSVSIAAMYNHAIAGLCLSEVYGMTDRREDDRIRIAIERAIRFTRAKQTKRKPHPADRGGWRYMHPHSDQRDSDLSVTVWHLMFLRSAKNAGFEVPSQWIDEAVGYVQRCFNPNLGVTGYIAGPCTQTRAMAGAGALSLSLAGLHETPMAQSAGRWILRHRFDRYNHSINGQDHYHYSAYYCAQAMFQLGGDYWRQFWPPLVTVLLANQMRDGSWPAESKAEMFGRTYSTSLVVLTLNTPNQILPIFQR